MKKFVIYHSINGNSAVGRTGGPLALALITLSACATLPSTGPTKGQIEAAETKRGNQIGYKIIPITPHLLDSFPGNAPSNLDTLSVMAASQNAERADIIRSGDQLAISIYEVGVSLFGSVTSVGTADRSVANPTANAQRLTVQVDEDGQIHLPYIGGVSVAGRSPVDVEQEIRFRLRPMSQSPEVMVAISDSVESVAYLTGAISKPGRYRLTAARERLVDLIALGGGVNVDPNDAEVRLVRGDQAGSHRLGDLRADDKANIRLLPGDRIEILRQPYTYSVFGAVDRVSQIPFNASKVTLAEAVARAGGPSDSRANPAAVFLFRYESGIENPVIYRLNLKDPQSYFLAQKFYMKDKDVLYFANSAANPPSKLINLINQLFSPLVTARILTQ